MTITVSEFIQERAMFFYKFLRSPAQIGSVTPSSKFLARAMVQSICWDKVNSVAEPGAGTGAITKYIQAAANADTRVLLFEKAPALYRELDFNMHNTDVTGMPAASNTSWLRSSWKEQHAYYSQNTVMVHIRNLREKIEANPRNPQYIKTVWGVGYRIDK